MLDFDSLLQFSFFLSATTLNLGADVSKEQEMNLSPQIFLFVRELKIQIILQPLGSPFFDFPFE